MIYYSYDLYQSHSTVFKLFSQVIIYMATHVRKVTSSIGANVYTLGNMPTPQQQMQQQMQQQKSIPDFESVLRKAQKIFEVIAEDAEEIYDIIVSDPRELLVKNAHELSLLKTYRAQQQEMQKEGMIRFMKKKK